MNQELYTPIFIALREDRKIKDEYVTALYDECARISRYYYRRYCLKSLMTQEDFLHEVCIHMWETKDKYDVLRSSFQTWFGLKCKAVAIRFIKKNETKKKKLGREICPYYFEDDGTQVDIFEQLSSDKDVSAEATYLKQADRDNLFAYLAQLRPNYRDAIVLVYVQGMKPAQAAEILGCKSSDVSNWLSRGLKQLRKSVEDVSFSALLEPVDESIFE